MRLIYVYIKKYRNIRNQKIRLSNQYRIMINHLKSFPECITIYRQKDNIEESIIYKESNLSDIHLIVGKTGSGKTNVLQMIGMPERERIYEHSEEEAYFLLYKAKRGFVIELFNIPVSVDSTSNELAYKSAKKLKKESQELPESVRKYSDALEAMHLYQFFVDDKGKPRAIIETSLDEMKKRGDITYIFNGYERNAFPFCPYEEERINSVNGNTKWQIRTNAEYHRTALWCSCRFLKEYIDGFGKDNIKRKAALIIERDNWAKTIKQHIDEDLKRSDYWTFAAYKFKDDENRMLGKTIKDRKYPKIQHQFVHDLWTDYALYLRKWIAYIEMFHKNEDDGTRLLHIEASPMLRYVYEKKRSENRTRKSINPTAIPDYEKLSILKRIKWLCMYIDQRGDGTPYHLLYQIYDDIKDIGQILNQFDEKYFTNDTFTLPIEEMYTEKNRELVEELFERLEQYHPDDTGIFTKELLPYHFSYISSGEYQFAKVLGGIEEFCVRLSVDEVHPNIIYLLDEPETYMHPELCRTFLKRLDTLLKERTSKADIQMIISTHSPLLLSDVLPGHVTRFDLDENGYCVIRNGTRKAYFGANIHTILADGFFLDYTIGEYARVFLQENINWLKDVLKKENQTIEELERVQELETLIPYIGDPMIKNSFKILIQQVEEEVYAYD